MLCAVMGNVVGSWSRVASLAAGLPSAITASGIALRRPAREVGGGSRPSVLCSSFGQGDPALKRLPPAASNPTGIVNNGTNITLGRSVLPLVPRSPHSNLTFLRRQEPRVGIQHPPGLQRIVPLGGGAYIYVVLAEEGSRLPTDLLPLQVGHQLIPVGPTWRERRWIGHPI